MGASRVVRSGTIVAGVALALAVAPTAGWAAPSPTGTDGTGGWQVLPAAPIDLAPV